MATGQFQTTVEEIKNVKRKTAQQQFCHNELANSYARRAKILDVSLTLLSALAVISTTAEANIILLDFIDINSQRRTAAFLTLIVFIMTLLRMEIRLSDIASSYRIAGEAHTRFLRQVDMKLTTVDSMTDEQIADLAFQLTEQYTGVTESAPSISSKNFMKLKQKFLQQKAISKELDNSPFLSIEEIKKKLT